MVEFTVRDAPTPAEDNGLGGLTRATAATHGRRRRITIRRTKALSTSLARLARRRLEFALARFAARVESLTVRLRDLNGPKGGIDRHCLVAVRLSRPRRLIVIEDTDVDAAVALNRAVGRAVGTVARAIQTRRDWRTAPSRH